MENSSVENFLEDVISINDTTQYWLVRTMGGDFYQQYVEDGFIAIGYNEIKKDDLEHLPEKAEPARKILQEMLRTRRESIRNVSYPASQILRFFRDIKEGDVVIVPSHSSSKVCFGVIQSNLYEETKGVQIQGRCPFSKRRSVRWIKISRRTSLPADLQLMFNSRHIISNVDSYAPHIDNLLNELYTKSGITYLVLRVKQDETLSADDFTLVSDLMELFNEYSKENGMGLTSSDIKMKMSVQSPGDILAFAKSPEGIMVIGLIIMFIKGGNFSGNWGGFNVKAKVPSPGESFAKIVTSVNSFLNDRTKRKTIDKLSRKLDNMEIETPSPIIEMMKELGKEGKATNDEEN